MKNFLLALQFLTIIPVRIRHVSGKALAGSVVYFPLVGLLLGLILTGANRFLSFLGLQKLFINIILVVLLVILTGGIHLDGMADTADAFFSRRSKEEKLRIMRDSRIGAMGVLSLISITLLKIAFISSIGPLLKPLALLLMCVLGRWAMVLSLFLFPYARQEGKAGAYIKGTDLKVFIFSTLTAFGCAVVIWRMYGFLLLLAMAALAYVIGRFVTGKISGITGDTLGATNEVIEAAVLFSICIIERIDLWI